MQNFTYLSSIPSAKQEKGLDANASRPFKRQDNHLISFLLTLTNQPTYERFGTNATKVLVHSTHLGASYAERYDKHAQGEAS